MKQEIYGFLMIAFFIAGIVSTIQHTITKFTLLNPIGMFSVIFFIASLSLGLIITWEDKNE